MRAALLCVCVCVCAAHTVPSAAVQVVVNAVQDDVPKGMQKILDVLQAAILETTLAPGS